jgi:hypothetical protein
MHGEATKLTNNSVFLAKAFALRPTTKPNTEEEWPDAAQEEKKVQSHRE